MLFTFNLRHLNAGAALTERECDINQINDFAAKSLTT